jgi:hypothetical protein
VLVIEPRSVAELNRDLMPIQARSSCASPAPTGCARFGPTETGRGLLSGVSRRNLALNAVFVDAARPIFSPSLMAAMGPLCVHTRLRSDPIVT